MIAFLKGIVAGKTAGQAFIDVGGVGYAVGMSEASLSKLPAKGEEVSVLTHLQVREDGIALFGFLKPEEKTLFEELISVSGVGPKVALAALSAFSTEALASAIATQDVALVSKIPGVGKKTASRIILELKGSLEQEMSSLFAQGKTAASEGTSAAVVSAIEALLSMGFTSAEANLALKDIPENASEKELLRIALKKLGQM